jgi:hypothetical protein
MIDAPDVPEEQYEPPAAEDIDTQHEPARTAAAIVDNSPPSDNQVPAK